MDYLLHRTVLLASLRNRGVTAPAKMYPAVEGEQEQAAQIARMCARRDEIDEWNKGAEARKIAAKVARVQGKGNLSDDDIALLDSLTYV